MPRRVRRNSSRPNHDAEPKAVLLDVDLPGGIAKVVESCLNREIPIVAMGAAPLKDTQYLIEIMYHGIPYVKKFDNDDQPKVMTIIARMNVLLTKLLLFSRNKEYERGLLGGLSSSGYKVIVANQPSDLTPTYLVSDPKMVLAYYPEDEDFEAIARIRAMDDKVPITVVLEDSENGLKDCALRAGVTTVLPKSQLANFLLKFRAVCHPSI